MRAEQSNLFRKPRAARSCFVMNFYPRHSEPAQLERLMEFLVSICMLVPLIVHECARSYLRGFRNPPRHHRRQNYGIRYSAGAESGKV